MCFHCSHQAGEFVYHDIRPRSAGQVARDEGTARVLDNAGQEWRDRIAFLIDDLARSRLDFTADDVRAAVQVAGLAEPHSPNAYGAAMLAAARWIGSRKRSAKQACRRCDSTTSDTLTRRS